ncbi:ATP-binding protein [Streptomyces cinnamoneus]|uniref:ATP-binding protein n=1 Tax=Streptomyces cinnamoneus TaxID=53446 RepID=UPI0033E67713
MPKIALYGRPGAGKTTLTGLLALELAEAGADVRVLKVGVTLYELQAIIYAVAGRPLLDGRDQDGQLLNALGSQIRRINPDALTDAFGWRVHQAEQAAPQSVLLCDDMRAPDVEAVAALGFRLVEVTAPEPVRLARKRGRGDLTAGDDQHVTEAVIDAVPWLRVDNAGSLDDLRQQATRIAREVLP